MSDIINPERVFFRLSFLTQPRSIWRERRRITIDLLIAQAWCRLYEARAQA